MRDISDKLGWPLNTLVRDFTSGLSLRGMCEMKIWIACGQWEMYSILGLDGIELYDRLV